MEFRILGAFEVVDQARPLELGGARQRLLLARLAVAANRVVALDTALDDLWGGEPPPGAKEALQAQVSRARKSLGDPTRLVARSPGYLLRLGPDELDATRFEALVGAARKASAGGDTAAAAASLRAAEAIWRGPALAEFADYPFAQAEAARLEELRLEVVEERIEADLALGRHGALIAELQGLVAAHPFRERLCAQWMLALYRAGRQTEALRAHTRVRRRLRDELGIEPGAELTRLEAAILSHRPELDWVPGPTRAERRHGAAGSSATPFAPVPASGRLSSLRLVGRRRERAALLHHLDAAVAGHPSLVVLAGEAGVGKSRLVAEVAEAAASDGGVVLAGGAADLGGTDVPYAPLAEAFRRWLRTLEPSEAAEAVTASGGLLAHLVPELAELADLADLARGEGPPSLGNPALLHGLLLKVIRRITASGPALLILEDLHWADPSTATAVEFLARNLTDEQLVVVVTVRTDELQPRRPVGVLVAALERCPAVRRVDVGTLDAGEVAELVTAIVGGTPDPGLVARVIARADGNALFIEELVAGQQDGADLGPTLRELLVSRVERLGDPAIRCAHLLAVAGRPLSHPLLATASELPQGELLSGLRQAVDGHVVVAEADAYRFRHGLVGEALCSHLLPGERSTLHARLAAAMAAVSTQGSAAERAHHWLAAGETGRALGALVEAAEGAERTSAYSEALASYQRALELWDQVPDAGGQVGCDRATLLERAGEAASLSERPRHAGGSVGSRLAAELTAAAADHVDPVGQPTRAGLLHARLAQHLWMAGRDGRAAADTAMRLVPPDPPSPERARILADCARGAVDAGSSEEGAALAGEACRLARAIGEAGIESEARTTFGAARTLLGHPGEGAAEVRRALVLAEQAGSPAGVMRAYHNLSAALLYDDRADEALAVLDEDCEVARRLGFEEVFAPRQLVRRAECLRVLGRWDEAVEVLDELRRRWPHILFRLHELAFLAGARGDEGALRRIFNEAAALDADPRLELQPLYRAQAELDLWLDRPAAARQELAVALEHLANVDVLRIVAPLLQLGIRAEADLREAPAATSSAADDAAAEARATDLHARLRKLTRSSDVRSSAAITAVADAELRRLTDGPTPEPWLRAVAAWEAVGAAYPTAYARWRAAEALVDTGGPPAEVEALLDASRASAERLGLAPLLRKLDRLTARRDLPAPAGS